MRAGPLLACPLPPLRKHLSWSAHMTPLGMPPQLWTVPRHLPRRPKGGPTASHHPLSLRIDEHLSSNRLPRLRQAGDPGTMATHQNNPLTIHSQETQLCSPEGATTQPGSNSVRKEKLCAPHGCSLPSFTIVSGTTLEQRPCSHTRPASRLVTRGCQLPTSIRPTLRRRTVHDPRTGTEQRQYVQTGPTARFDLRLGG